MWSPEGSWQPLFDIETAKTVLGQVLTIDSAAEVMVDDATVVQTDMLCTHDVIHVIDSEMMPNECSPGGCDQRF
jgi:uncharacterized surface protein with fasciclin (FAS1) repeats